MPAASSRDLRDRLLQAHDAGVSDAAIARTTGVSVRSLGRWRARRAQGQSLAPTPPPGLARRLSSEQEAHVVAQVAEPPAATLDEHRMRLAAEHGLRMSRATTGRILQRHRLTLKKRV